MLFKECQYIYLNVCKYFCLLVDYTKTENNDLFCAMTGVWVINLNAYIDYLF